MYSEIKNIYSNRIKRKALKMPYFYRKFHYPRLVKSIIVLPVSLLFFLLKPNLEDRTIVYRPKKNERKALLRWKNVVLMGGYDDFLFAKKMGFPSTLFLFFILY